MRHPSQFSTRLSILFLLLGLVLPAVATARGRETTLDDFGPGAPRAHWSGSVKLAGEHCSHGATCAAVRFDSDHRQVIATGFASDWRGYDRLLFDIYSDREGFPTLTLRIYEKGAGEGLDSYFEAPSHVVALKGWTHVIVKLPLMAASWKRDLNLAHIGRIELSTRRVSPPWTIHVDNFRLVEGKEGPQTASRTQPQDAVVTINGRWFNVRQVARPQDVPESPEVTRLRKQAQKERALLEKTIEAAKLQGLHTIYAERRLVTADLGLRIRPLLPWFNTNEKKREMFSYVARTCRAARFRLEDLLRGVIKLPEADDTRVRPPLVPPYPPRLKGSPIKGWFYRDHQGEPMIIISLHSGSKPLQRFFATPFQHIESYSVAGASRWTLGGSLVYKAFKKYPDTHRVGWDGWCGHIITDLWDMGGTQKANVVIDLESPHIRQAIAEYIRINTPKFAANPQLLYNIMGYELMYICYCPRSQQMFHDWLRRKHGTIERADQEWGTHYPSFAAVVAPPVKQSRPLPGTNRALWYDWARFNMDRFIDYLLWVKSEIRRYDPDTPVAAGGSYYMVAGDTGTSGIDEERIVNEVDDVIIHEGAGSTLGMDLQRALAEKKKPLVDPEMNLHSVKDLLPHILHGKSVIQLFHWSAQPSNEFPSVIANSLAQSWKFSLADIDELLRATLDARRLHNEIAAFANLPAEAAILYSQTSTLQLPPKMLTWRTTPYLAELKKTYEASEYLDARVTFVTERQIRKGWLDRYKILLVPAVRNLPADVVEKIWSYAASGGRVVVLPESFVGDEYNHPRDYLAKLGISIRKSLAPKPEPGAMVQGYDLSFRREVTFANAGSVNLIPERPGLPASVGTLRTEGIRQVVSTGANADIWFQFPDGNPALARIPVGRGFVYYSATSLKPASYARLLDTLFDEAGLTRKVRVRNQRGRSEWKVEARFVVSGGRKLLYVINFNSHPVRLRVEAPRGLFHRMKELRAGKQIEGNRITVPARQTAIYELF